MYEVAGVTRLSEHCAVPRMLVQATARETETGRGLIKLEKAQQFRPSAFEPSVLTHELLSVRRVHAVITLLTSCLDKVQSNGFLVLHSIGLGVRGTSVFKLPHIPHSSFSSPCACSESRCIGCLLTS